MLAQSTLHSITPYLLQFAEASIPYSWVPIFPSGLREAQSRLTSCPKMLSHMKQLASVGIKPTTLMPLFHQRIKPRSCRRPLIVGSLGKNGKKIDQWGGRQNRCEGLGLTTDRPQDAPGGPRQSLTGLGLRTD